MKAYLVTLKDVMNQQFSSEITLPEDSRPRLQEMYRLIGCNLVDVIQSQLPNGELVDVWIDEEGLLTRGVKLGTKIRGFNEPLVGNLIVTGSPDSKGNPTPAPDNFNIFDLVEQFGACRIG